MNTKIRQEIEELVSEILEIPIGEIGYEEQIENIPEWDSMKNVIILSTLEEKYDILIPSEDIFELTSLKAVVEEIEKLV